MRFSVDTADISTLTIRGLIDKLLDERVGQTVITIPVEGMTLYVHVTLIYDEYISSRVTYANNKFVEIAIARASEKGKKHE